MTAIEPTEAVIDSVLEEAAAVCENAYGGGSSQVWNDSFAELLRDMKSTGRTPYKFTALRSSAPQEPDDALTIQIIAQVLWEKVGPAITAPRAADIARDIYAALSVAQEPVADDDAEWLRQFINNPWLYVADRKRLERIADRLQAIGPNSRQK